MVSVRRMLRGLVWGGGKEGWSGRRLRGLV